MTRPLRLVSLVLAAALGGFACGGDAGPSRADTVAAMTTAAVPDRYLALASQASALTEVAADWCSGDGAELADQVAATRVAWASVSPFWFGPVAEQRSRFIIDPTASTDDILEILNATDPLDASALRSLYGADQRGLEAIEEVVELIGDDDRSGRPCEYVTASAELVAEETGSLASAWEASGVDFGADDGIANEAIELMVNEVLFGLVTLENDPDVAVAKARLGAMRWAILGDSAASGGAGEGIAPLLDSEVVEQLTQEFDAAAELDGDALAALEMTITTNVVSALGLSVQFSDADGDG